MAGVGLGEAYERARTDRNLLSLREAIAALEARIEQLLQQLELTPGPLARETWQDILSWMEQRRKLSETEAKIGERAYRALTGEELMALASPLAAIITRHVGDRQTRAKIAQDVRALQVQTGANR